MLHSSREKVERMGQRARTIENLLQGKTMLGNFGKLSTEDGIKYLTIYTSF
jgi:hypothetical protein